MFNLFFPPSQKPVSHPTPPINFQGDLNGKATKLFNDKPHIIRSQSHKPLQEDIQTDQTYAQDILSIVKFKKVLQKAPIQGNNNFFMFTQQKYEEIHQKALLHRNANKFNTNTMKKSDEVDQKDMCKCGCNKAQGGQLPFLSDEQKLNFLGPGIILFFYYLKCIILLLMIVAVGYGTLPLALNLSGGIFAEPQLFCGDSYTVTEWFCQFKVIASVQNRNSSEALNSLQFFSGVGLCLVWILGLRLIRYYGRIKNKLIDNLLDSSSDYCVQINELPYGKYHQTEILQVLGKLYDFSETKVRLQYQPLSIRSVQIIYNMSEFRKKIIELEQKILEAGYLIQVQKNDENQQQLQKEKPGRLFRVDSSNIELYKILKIEILELYRQLISFREKFLRQEEFRQKFATNTCLVEFCSSEQQTQFLQEFGRFRYSVLRELKQKLVKFLFPEKAPIVFKNKYLILTRAPQPSDIDWENCEKQFHYWRIGAVWLVTLMVVGASFGMLMLIAFLRKRVPLLKDLSILVSISLQLFNRLIWKILVWVVSWEENNTKTDRIISIMSKASFAQAVNVLVLPIVMNAFLRDNLSGPNGLTGLVLDFQFTVFLMMIAMNFVDPPYQMKKLELSCHWSRKRVILSLAKIAGTDYDYKEIRDILNYYQQPDFPIAGAYVYMLTTVNQAFFYCYLQPSLLIVILVNMGLFFLIQKYLLLKRCKIPALTDLIVFETCVSLALRVPLYFGVGTLFFLLHMGQGKWALYVPCILVIVVALAGIYNPQRIFTKLMWCLIGEDKEEKKPFSDKILQTDLEGNLHENSTNNFFAKQQLNRDCLESVMHDKKANRKNKGNGEQNKQHLTQTSKAQRSQIFQEGYCTNKNSQQSQRGQSPKILTRKQHSNATSVLKTLINKDFAEMNPSERRECYYKNSNLNQILSFQNYFRELENNQDDLSKRFCQQFYCNVSSVNCSSGQSHKLSVLEVKPPIGKFFKSEQKGTAKKTYNTQSGTVVKKEEVLK